MKPTSGPRISVILARAPTYSESFLCRTYAALRKEGFQVLFFAQDGDSKESSVPLIQLHSENRFFVFRSVGFLFRSHPQTIFRFLRWERRSGKSWIQSLKGLLLNSHILAFPTDWIHFAFSTFAIGRENLAAALGAKMEVGS